MMPDNPFYGKAIAITGKLDNYTRDGIKTRLLELGVAVLKRCWKNADLRSENIR